MDDTLDVEEILKGAADRDALAGDEFDEEAILGMKENVERATVAATVAADAAPKEHDVGKENGAQPSSSSTSSVLVDNDEAEQLDYEEDVAPAKPSQAAVSAEAQDAEGDAASSEKPTFKTERVYHSVSTTGILLEEKATDQSEFTSLGRSHVEERRQQVLREPEVQSTVPSGRRAAQSSKRKCLPSET